MNLIPTVLVILSLSHLAEMRKRRNKSRGRKREGLERSSRGLVPQLMANYSSPSLPPAGEVVCSQASLVCANREGCGLALQHYIALCFASGAHARALVQLSIFRKVLVLPTVTIQDVTAGQLTNLMSKDAGKIQDFLLFGHNIWSAPLTAAWVTLSLFLVLGWAAVPGVLCTIAIIPMQSKIARYAARLRRETMTHSDVRQRIMGALLQGVRVVKLNAWEHEVRAAVQAARTQELSFIRRFNPDP